MVFADLLWQKQKRKKETTTFFFIVYTFQGGGGWKIAFFFKNLHFSWVYTLIGLNEHAGVFP